MKDHAAELKSSARRGAKADTEGEVLEKIAGFGAADRVLAERIHAIVKEAAPALSAKLYYGMPAYARDGKIVCFFQPAQKFKTRYATLGFNDAASLDDGAVWPTAYALTKLSGEEEKRIAALIRQAAS
jgi:uncharacterized protein YdhG (YjbR/CyaY superfamily)